MNRIGTANPKEVPDSLQIEYKAEARGLRAIYYFYLVRMYGPVVLLGDNLISADASTTAVRLLRPRHLSGSSCRITIRFL